MAPTAPSDITDVPENLSKLHIAQPNPAMHDDPPNSIGQPSENNRAKLTLETLPPEIKNEIFSHFLLAAKVKYSTDGSWPGNKYKFDTTIMRVNKQMKQDATTYLFSQNEFALISSKFFAFEIDKKRFLPTVATGKAARTFQGPAIEATITHVGATTCTCCNPQKHKAKDRATHALFLVADLEHLMREQRLTYHIWPSKPIYIMSEYDVSPVKHIPVNIDTQIKIVWKIHPSHRPDLTVAERRARQTRLLAPLDFPTGSGKKISVIGVDKDIAHNVTDRYMPRILSIDGVGWDLYNLLKAQKKHLDNILSQDPSYLSHRVHSYTDIACTGWGLNITGHWRNAIVTSHAEIYEHLVSLCMMPFENLDSEEYEAAAEDSWQIALVSLVIDCLFTVLRLGLEDNSFDHMKESVTLISTILTRTFRPQTSRLLPRRFMVLLGHYMTWLMCHEKASSGTAGGSVFVQTRDKLNQFLEMLPADDEDDVWHAINEDREFLSRVVAGQIQPWTLAFGGFTKPCVNFRGLLNRPRIHNTRVHIKPSLQTLRDWTTKQGFPKVEVAAQMIKFADDFPKLKLSERDREWNDRSEGHGHIANSFLNLSLAPVEEEIPSTPPNFIPFFTEINGVAMLGDMRMFMPGGVPPS